MKEIRVFAISDIHTDYLQNLQWVENLSDTIYLNDIIIVAGDISQQINTIEKTLRIIKSKFKYVFYCTGNVLIL